MQWKHHQPLFWSLFAAGGMISAFCLPAIILLVGIAYPLGWLPEGAFSYQNMLALCQNWLAKLIMLFTFSFTLWHCAHRVFKGLHDFGYHGGVLARSLTYGTAGFGSMAFLVLLLTI